MKQIIFIYLTLIGINCYSNSYMNRNASYSLVFPNKIIDTFKLETKYGFIKIINDCDSNLNLTNISGVLFDTFMKEILTESEEFKMDSDKGSLILKLSDSGLLLECILGNPPKLKAFKDALQQFMIEINLGYKNKTILSCTDKSKKGKTYLEIHFYFKIEEQY